MTVVKLFNAIATDFPLEINILNRVAPLPSCASCWMFLAHALQTIVIVSSAVINDKNKELNNNFFLHTFGPIEMDSNEWWNITGLIYERIEISRKTTLRIKSNISHLRCIILVGGVACNPNHFHLGAVFCSNSSHHVVKNFITRVIKFRCPVEELRLNS